jgi:Holliday junction resolvase-like predicted endonuclease
MDDDLNNLIDKLRQELFLEYEYESPKQYPREFVSSFDLLNKSETKENTSIPITINNQKVSISHHFQSDDIIKLKTNQYYYIPTKETYQNLFECIQALQQTFEIEDILKAFQWQDFENFLCQSLEQFGYVAIRTFRFSIHKKRHEVDIIGRDGQRILFIDAKHWNNKTASSSALIRSAENQIIRAQHLIKNVDAAGALLQRLGFSSKTPFHDFKIYPILLVSSNLKSNQIMNGVPILSVFRFNEFLTQFSSIEHSLKPIILSKVAFQTKLK